MSAAIRSPRWQLLPWVVLLGCASLFAPTPVAAEDAWFGRDKALHFGASATIAAGGYALSSTFERSRGGRALWGAGAGLTAGVAKELYDAAGYGDPSYRDLVWDVVGVGVGVGLAWLLDLAMSPDGASSPAAAPSATVGAPPMRIRLRF